MKALKIFLSSTRATLVDERDALHASLSLANDVIWMEDFGSRGESALETCLSELENCDLCVVLVGHRYGSIVPRYNASYTETEYEHARECKIDVHAYVKAGFETALASADHPERLRDFRAALERGLTVHRPEFQSVDGLVDRVQTDIESLEDRRSRRPRFPRRLGAIGSPGAYGNGAWRRDRLVLQPFPVTIVELPVMEVDSYPTGGGSRLRRKVNEVLQVAQRMGVGAVIFNRIPVDDPGPVVDQRLRRAHEGASAIVCLARGETDLKQLRHFEGFTGQLSVWYPADVSLPEPHPDAFYESYTDQELQDCTVALGIIDRLEFMIANHLATTI